MVFACRKNKIPCVNNKISLSKTPNISKETPHLLMILFKNSWFNSKIKRLIKPSVNKWM